MASKLAPKTNAKTQPKTAQQDTDVISCPLCAFFKVLQGTDVVPIYTKGDGADGKQDRKSRTNATRTGATQQKWRDFEETVKSTYLKSTRKNRKDIADFDESSEHIIPEGLTDFIEDEEKKKNKKGKS